MRKSLHLRYVLPIAIILSLFGAQVKGQGYTENFDDVSLLGGNGWFIQNNSSPLGSNSWYQGIPTTATPDPGPFNAYNGAVNAYIAANFASTTGGSGTISNWLVTPNRTLRNGDVFTFYTRKPTIGAGQTDYPDRLEVRLSTNGASTNVGTTATGLGDFTTLLLSINPTLATNVYPQTWTQFTVTISGLSAPTSGRIAFRYFVTNGGPSGANSDYIGVDNVVYTPYVCPAFTLTPGGALTSGTAGVNYSQTLSQTGALGTPNFAITAGSLPPGLTLSASGTISGTPTATGTFNFTVTVNDNSGCSGSQAYSITVLCPTNVVSLVLSPNVVCDNAGLVTLSGGSPAGGTYSGTGVSSSQFDPASGSQTITYDYTDSYGCAYSASATLTVYTSPVVTLAPFSAACSYDQITLSGGLPAGGTYSGTGVTGGVFDATTGTQTITYTYTDANSCTNNANQSLAVNAAPVVDLGNDVTQCGGTSTLDAANSGATYLWNDNTTDQTLVVSSTGNYTVTITDGNGCTATDDVNVTINALPVVDLGNDVEQCGGSITLDAANAGAGFLWSDNTTDQTLTVTVTGTYSVVVTDANNCTGSDEVDVTIYTVPTVDLGNDVTQCGGSVTLDAANAGATYAWSDNSTNQTVVASSTGNYAVTITDGNGCTATDDVDVTLNALPVVDLGSDVEQCGGSANLDAANAGASYIWSDNSTNQTLTVTTTGTYSVTVTDANNCTGTGEVDVTINLVPSVDLGNDVTQCGGSVTLDAANAGATYAWTDNSTNQTLEVTATGTYGVTITDANNCTATGDVDVTINAVPTVDLGSAVTQCGGSVTLDAANAGATYTWTDNSTGQTLEVTASGTYGVTITDANSCTATDDVDVVINALPTVTFDPLNTICNNAGIVTLSGGAPAGGVYSGTGVSGTAFDPGAGTQVVTYTYTDNNGCTAAATQTQTVDNCTGITQIEDAGISCFPNPTTTALTVVIASVSNTVSVRIVDITGKLIVSDEEQSLNGTYRKVFDTANFAQGMYVVEIRNGNNFTTKRISKQ